MNKKNQNPPQAIEEYLRDHGLSDYHAYNIESFQIVKLPIHCFSETFLDRLKTGYQAISQEMANK